MNDDSQLIFKRLLPIDTTVLITIVSVALIALKLMSVSSGNLETADAILQAQGTGTVIVGAFLTIIGLIVAPVGMALAVMPLAMDPEKNPERFSYATLAGGVLLLVAIESASWYNLVVSFTGALLLATLADILFLRQLINSSVPSWKRRSVHFRRFLNLWIAFYLAAVIVAVALASTPWMPTQSFTIRRSAPVVGYLLSRDSTEIVILNEFTGIVQNLPTQDVTSMEECTVSNYWQKETLSQVVPILRLSFAIHYTQYPSCPRGKSYKI
jgi:hypothetical protein